jgi:cell division protein ZapE
MKKVQINEKTIILDKAQIKVFNDLEDLRLSFSTQPKENLFFSKIKNIFLSQSRSTNNNFYIYGKVGRGKSMLMRLFFDSLIIKDKYYCHFNSFMQDLHKELHLLRKLKSKNNQTSNLVFLAVKRVIGKSQIICFDEMQVEDVADAMIIRDVFSFFFQNNITVVTTSNCHPLELYQNGLQREVFLDFIKNVVIKNFKILNLDNKVDYRGRFLMSKKHYFYPNNSQNKKEVLELFQKITNQEKTQEKEIEVLGSRKLLVKKSYKNIALFEFDEICKKQLGVLDFQAICGEFNMIFLLNIPKLSKEDRNEAKRLILFIDEVYESKAQLVVLASAAPEEIYIAGVGSKAFKRTASRLNEIGVTVNE